MVCPPRKQLISWRQRVVAAMQQQKKKNAVNSNPHADDHEWPLAVVLVDLGSADFPEEKYSNFLRGSRERRARQQPATADTTTADSKAGI